MPIWFQRWNLQDIFWPNLVSQKKNVAIQGKRYAKYWIILAVILRLTHDLKYVYNQIFQRLPVFKGKSKAAKEISFCPMLLKYLEQYNA